MKRSLCSFLKSKTAVVITPEASIQLRRRAVFPFTAIVGQEEMKLALIFNIIDPKIGGVMIMGDRSSRVKFT